MLGESRIDYETKLNISEALIQYGESREKEIGIDFLINLAHNSSLGVEESGYRSQALEILEKVLSLSPPE